MTIIQRESKPQKEMWRYISLVSEVGLSVAVPMAVSGLAGRWMDKQFTTAPWMTVILLVVGTIISIFNFASVIKKITM